MTRQGFDVSGNSSAAPLFTPPFDVDGDLSAIPTATLTEWQRKPLDRRQTALIGSELAARERALAPGIATGDRCPFCGGLHDLDHGADALYRINNRNKFATAPRMGRGGRR